MGKIILAGILVLCLSLTGLSQKYYWYSSITMSVDLTADGKAYFTQEREYQFRGGSFSNAFIALFDPYYKVTVTQVKDMSSSSTSYSVVRDGYYTKVSIFFDPNYSSKKFYIQYYVLDAVNRYWDYGHFYWKLLEDYHERIDTYTASVSVPTLCGGVKYATVYYPYEYKMAFIGERATFASSMSSNQNLIIKLSTDERCFPLVYKKSNYCCPDDYFPSGSSSSNSTVVVIVVVVIIVILLIAIGGGVAYRRRTYGGAVIYDSDPYYHADVNIGGGYYPPSTTTYTYSGGGGGYSGGGGGYSGGGGNSGPGGGGYSGAS